MKEMRGVVTREELEASYSGAEIAMLDTGNDATNSGEQSAGGRGDYIWSVTWDDNGFTGINWKALGIDYSVEFPDEDDRDAEIRSLSYNIAMSLNQNYYTYEGCFEFTLISSN